MKWSKGLCELAPESQLWADLFSSAEKRPLIEYDVFPFLPLLKYQPDGREKRRREQEEILLTLECCFLFTYIIFQHFNSFLFSTKPRLPLCDTACKQLGCFSCGPPSLPPPGVEQSRDGPPFPKSSAPSECGMTPPTPSLPVLYVYHPLMEHWRASCTRDVPSTSLKELRFWLTGLSYCRWQLRGPRSRAHREGTYQPCLQVWTISICLPFSPAASF